MYSRGAQADSFMLILKDSRTDGVLNFYSGISMESPVRNAIHHYDPRMRSWYRDADKNKLSSWSVAYQDIDDLKGISISYNSPIYDVNKRYVGVVSSDIKLEKFNHYLREIPNLGHGVIFIVNGDNKIISHSTVEKEVLATSQGLASFGKCAINVSGRQ
ncbi:cache domain-containing protein [Budvicia aquatica]|uniref:Cache domain n=1 Tax=Budvicia aquatica TaxID=82979 RepID=A0A484ZVN9_9GAMM|nr:cache domain-containing protein [Budvicia aquatica]VFS51776.1 Cache domain [Budvicia aquatica]